jgi:hypothetical protein
MNYYELNDFKSIETSQLILAFRNGKTITTGCISVFEDSIGKPGDRLVELKNITEENNRIIFEFANDEKIIIESPSHIVINDKVIGIQNSDKVNWITKELCLKYIKVDEIVETKVLEGEHFFRIKQNSSALLIYTW